MSITTQLGRTARQLVDLTLSAQREQRVLNQLIKRVHNRLCPATAWLMTYMCGRTAGPESYTLTRWIFGRLLGLVYLIAIVSLWSQIHGLIGVNGILPAGKFLKHLRESHGTGAYWSFPTICWFSTDPAMLTGLCAVGTMLALMLLIGAAPGPSLLGLWLIYLSLSIVGQAFLSFQWDTLLLEVGFVAMFWCPWHIWPLMRPPHPSHKAGLWLLRCLLFKLMFLSGITKYLSGDPTWHELTALNIHYETQPLPTWIGWYAHQLPLVWQKWSVGAMYITEMVLPILVFARRRLRLVACVVLVLFQATIAMTGNYGFFNLLTMVLCVSLLDDQILCCLLPKRCTMWLGNQRAPHAATWFCATIWVSAASILLASTMTFLHETVRTMRNQQEMVEAGVNLKPLATPVVDVLNWSDRWILSWGQHGVLSWVSPFRTINGYGLFRNMTTNRYEIAIEASSDRQTWYEYRFRWKPGHLDKRPSFVAPYQPRLDWQMWFAAINPQRNAYWLNNLMFRLLTGSRDVQSLFAKSNFLREPPLYVRQVIYQYRFTDYPTRQQQGNWWERRLVKRRPIMTLSQR